MKICQSIPIQVEFNIMFVLYIYNFNQNHKYVSMLKVFEN